MIARALRALVPLLVALAGAPSALAGTLPPQGLQQIAPGVTYERLLRPGPQVIHVVRVLPGQPLVSLTPVLTAGSPARRGTLTGAMAARLPQGAVAGMNADYFNLKNAYPSGILLDGGELVSEPEPTRSAAVFPPTGGMAPLRLQLAGRYQAVDPAGLAAFPVRSFDGLNRPAERATETLLYTARFGPATPVAPARTEAVVALDGGVSALVNTPLAGTVVATKTGGGVPIGPGQVVVTGVGGAGAGVATDLQVGRRVNLELAVPGIPPGGLYAVGGGPLLVQDGVPVPDAFEGFTASQLTGRTERSALGQTANGTMLLVTLEGPAQGSVGATAAEQGVIMASLGAVSAIGFDSGGSAEMALGNRLVIPWASERPITDALVVTYRGVRLDPLPVRRISPNRDGVDDSLATTAWAPVPGQLVVRIERRGGGAGRTLVNAALGPGSAPVSVDPRALGFLDGPYALTATLTPADGSAPTTDSRPVIVDRTLARLRLKGTRVGRRRALSVGFVLTRPARVTALVRDAGGKVVKVLARNRRFGRGPQRVLWDLRLRRKDAPAGSYAVEVEARTSLGRPTLSAPVTVGPSPRRAP